MILKACAGEDDIPACVDRQIAHCVQRLTEGAPEGLREQRRLAADRLRGEREKLTEDLEALRRRMNEP